jgi:RHS repeat-associated protein
LTRPNGVNTNYTYDSVSHLLSVLHQAGSTTLDGASYSYDYAGNRVSKTNHLNNVTEGYSYDAIYELTQVVKGGSTSETYSYDPVGNRLSSLTVPSYSYDPSNELTSSSAGSYTYDANGNTLTDASGRSFTWDFENRLISAIVPGTGTVTFKYDPFGRRVQKSSTLGTTNYLYDGDNLLEDVDSSGNVLGRIAQTKVIDGELSWLQSGTVSYYQGDALGSVTSLSNSLGAVTNTYVFDGFGKLTASTGTLTNPFQFTAREFDPETGLYYHRARYYDSSEGRFVSEDPIRFRGGSNFFAYVRNNSINRIDPRGLCPCPSCGTGMWSGAGANFGGILVSGGAFTGFYKVSCWGGNTSCWIMTECHGLGLGLGGSVDAESIWIKGAYTSCGLGGNTTGAVVSGGVGLAAAGGSFGSGSDDPFNPGQKLPNPSSSSGGAYGAGVGAGGGYILGVCSTTVLRCSK